MWPYLFGAGWLWDTVLSAALVAAVIGAFAILAAPGREPAGYAEAAGDRIQRIWHSYEQGDLTEWEFARLVAPRHPAYEGRAFTAAAAKAIPSVKAAPSATAAPGASSAASRAVTETHVARDMAAD